jgi:hypothetical protein
MNTQQRIIASLFVVSILLLAANIIIGKAFKTENTIIPPKFLNADQIDSLFRIAVSNFGVNTSELKPKKLAEIKMADEYPAYLLSLPGDLPIPVFLFELNEVFNGFEVDIFSSEKKKSGKTVLTIRSQDIIMLGASVDYNPDLLRDVKTVGFLLPINDETNKNIIDELLVTPEIYSFLITPSVLMKKFIATNQNQNKQFALLLGDDIRDLDFKFQTGYSERRLKSSVRNLLGAFPKAAFFIIDDNSSFYNSDVYPFVENEFLNRKIKLVKSSQLLHLNGNIEGISSQFNEIMQMLNPEQSILIVSYPEDYLSILDEIKSYRKIGYNFSIPSDIVFNNNKVN